MLVQSINHIRTVIPVNAMAEFETFEPYLNKVEAQVFNPLLGQDLYTELNAVADDSGNDDQKELLKLIRFSLINLSMFRGFDMLNVTFDDSGFERVSSDKALYRYQEENLKNGFKNEGFDGIDTVLEFLQTNLEKFTAFKKSAFYTDLKESFFPTTPDFNKVFGIGNSRLVFLQIAQYFDHVLTFEIKPLLGSVLFDKVITEMQKDTDQDADLMTLIPYIRKPLAFLSVAIGYEELGIQITEKGLFFENLASGNSNPLEITQISENKRFSMTASARQNGTRYKEILLDFLKSNADKYPDFTQTDLDNTNPFRRDNTGKKTFFA